MPSSNDIRTGFLDYFNGLDHAVVDSSPLVPRNDPTLMFTNAGMVQFKNVFTGLEHRDYSRATTAQKCVRAGGKHNDLENVGYTARHHTFFEMLGNFSFGDYFKAEAIEYAWDYIHKEIGLPAEKLMITVYAEDDEAFDLWKKIAGLPEDRIFRNATSDNFWAMGETGPCGPCSEIFYDHGPDIPGGPPGSPDEDGDRWVEIWNLVFMQYDQISKDERRDLPSPSIDTGMGLERLAAVLQGTHDNYETDQFQALINASAEITGTAPDGEHGVSHRVIADHLRASVFLMADGVLPSNDGRGYVLRRIMRRAMRHAELMGYKDPLLHRLVPTLTGMMGKAYPEILRAETLATDTLKTEETRFKQTLERGLKLLDEESGKLGEGGTLSGDVAFKLYDTYGFPLDLTQDALRPRGLSVDVEGFNKAMARQREAARKHWAGSGEAATDEVWFGIRDDVGATEFLGYQTEAADAQVVALVKDGKPVKEAKKGDDVQLVVNQTPFYGEAGGQVGDTGVILGDDLKARVSDTTKKVEDLFVHDAKIEEGEIKVGDDVHLKVDSHRRTSVRANHSATHLLHAALRKHLGEHITQKGSLVAPDRLRFDISHPKALSEEELSRIEHEVNEQIRKNEAVETRLMTPDEAIEQGAMALFGEKYGDEVRVVSMGAEDDHDYSVELCGGTHVRRTGDIGVFKIIGESAVGSGVRRIEAVTGEGAEAYIASQDKVLRDIAGALKVPPGKVPERVSQLLEDRKKLERDLVDMRKKLASGGGGGAAEQAAKEVNGVKFVGRVLEGVPAKELKGMADDLKAKVGSGVVALVAVNDGKATLVVGVTDDLTGKKDAVELVKAGSQAVGGKGGGGRADMAQAGGPDGAKADAALEAIEAAIAG